MSAELRALVREVIADHPGANPTELAGYVAKLTPQQQILDFYAEALHGYVAEIVGFDRRSSMDKALGRNVKNRSAKLVNRRLHFAAMMTESVRAAEGWKQVGDCTIDDLRFCIQERVVTIERTQRQISNFEQLVDLMKQHEVRVAKDLLGVLK